jgi:hypothetical protein
MKVSIFKESIDGRPVERARDVFLEINFERNTIPTSLMDKRRSII